MAALIVFDLDGTLIDSRRDLTNAVNALLRELGRPPLAETQVGDMVGDGAAVLVRRALAAAGLPSGATGALPRFLQLYDDRLLEHTRPYDGIVQALQVLAKRAALAVLTNKPQAATERILAGLHLTQYFEHVVGGDTRFGRKPDPTGLLDIVGRAVPPAGSTVLVGDSPVDLETARRAGCRIVLASYGFGFRPVELRTGERLVARPSELANLF